MVKLIAGLLVFCMALIYARASIGQDVLITEFMAQRSVTVLDDDGDRAEFIELYNAGDSDADLSGYFLSDDCSSRFKWTFPDGIVIAPGEFLVVWATQKDRRDPCCALHTNFRLDGAGGECVVLSDSFGDQIHVYSFFPTQVLGYSFGMPMAGELFVLVPPGAAPCTATVPGPTNPISGLDWTQPDYDDSAWLTGTTGVGFDLEPDYLPFIGLDLDTLMHNINPSCYVRVPFHVDDPAAMVSFEFSMRYDDGYIAYVNGTHVASKSAPDVPTETSSARRFRRDAFAVEFEENTFDEGTPTLRAGENILALHGLNETIDSSDLLLVPDFVGLAPRDIRREVRHYFSEPTPGEVNSNGGPGLSTTPVISEPSGAYAPGLEVTVSPANAVEGAEMRYTLDGTVPNLGSPVYQGPLVINAEAILSVSAFEPGLLPSEPAVSHYVVLGEDLLDFSSTVPFVVCSTFGHGITGQCSAGPYTPGTFLLFKPGEDGRAHFMDDAHLAHRSGYRRRGNPGVGCLWPKFYFNVEFQNQENGDKDVQFLDFASHSDFAMWGPYSLDRSLMRNPLAYWMNREIGRWAPRTEFVECFWNLNGDPQLTMSNYFGVYVLMERNERGVGRVDVDRLTSGTADQEFPAITGGYIMQRDRDKVGDTAISAGGYNNIVITNPKNPTAAQQTYLKNYINQAVAGFTPNIAKQEDSSLYDVGSFRDYHILMWFSKNVDAFRFSAYMHKPRNGPLIAGPSWDNDRIMGANDPRCRTPTGWHNDVAWDSGALYFEHPGHAGDSGTMGSWYGLFFGNRVPTNSTPWAKAYRRRWAELRVGPLKTTTLDDQIDAWAAILEEPATRNTSRWGGGAHSIHVAHLKDWIETRGDWIDLQFSRIDGPYERRLQGDLNESGGLEISDAILLVLNLFTERVQPCQTDAGSVELQDIDGDGVLTQTDAFRLLSYLFADGPPPAAGLECEYMLGCAGSGVCE